VATFLVATSAVELAGGEADVASVKHWIARMLVVMVAVMLTAGLSGRRLAGRSRAPVVRRKLARMKLITATGAFVLVPCAITLDRLAAAGRFDATFALVQIVELAAGAGNLALLALNFRDGLALRACRGRGRVATTPTHASR